MDNSNQSNGQRAESSHSPENSEAGHWRGFGAPPTAGLMARPVVRPPRRPRPPQPWPFWRAPLKMKSFHV